MDTTLKSVSSIILTGPHLGQPLLTVFRLLAIIFTLLGVAAIPLQAAVAPTVATSAKSTPTIVTGLSSSLSVLGSDSAGELTLKYTWSLSGANPGPVTFVPNGTNAAKKSQANFTKPGTYNLLCTITNTATLTTSSAVQVTVTRAATSIAMSPATVRLNPSVTQLFSATVKDQFGLVMTPAASVVWAVTPTLTGTIDSAGRFTAGDSGTATVTATLGVVIGSATASINAAPTITTAATALPALVTGKTAKMTVVAADDMGELLLTYTWQSAPVGVTFSANGTNAAKSVTATFPRAGNYALRCSVQDAAGLTTVSDVIVPVNQVATALAVTPVSASINLLQTQTYQAVLNDQYGAAMVTQPIFTWSMVANSSGNLNKSTGVFSATSTAGGPYAITVTGGNRKATATITVVDAPPAVALAATITPGIVTGTTAVLTVGGADDGGESQLIYTWDSPTGPAPVQFSVNKTNVAKRTTVTFAQSGTYSLRCTIADANNQAVTTTVTGIVNQKATDLVASPSSITLAPATKQQFTAQLRDQFQAPMASQPTIGWTLSVGTSGSITATGLFTAGSTVGGPYTVTATGGGKTTTAFVSVGTPNAAPTVATAATASPVNVIGTTTALSVLGADDGALTALTYTWSTTGAPPAAVSFSRNGTNAAKSSVATFTKAGVYGLRCVIKDAAGATVSSSVTVTVTSTASRVVVSPATASIMATKTQLFQAKLQDQFAIDMTVQPTWAWSVTTTVNGTIAPTTGLFTAKTTPGGPVTVSALGGGITGTATLSVIPLDAPPTVVTAATAATPVSGTTTTLSALGADDGGALKLTYTWATTGAVPAAVTFVPNGTNTAKNAVATFTKAGNYSLRCTIQDLLGQKVTSTVAVVVQQTTLNISITPSVALLAPSATQQFSAVVRDQFANALLAQPVVTWSLVGSTIGTMNPAGLFTASSTAGGSGSVIATAGSVQGRAQVSVEVPNQRPVIATPARASVTPVTGSSVILTALGSDDQDPVNLTYNWSVINTPPALVTFSQNQTNAAQTTSAQFVMAGTYTFQCTITDQGGLTVASTVVVNVAQTPTSAGLIADTQRINPGQTVHLTPSVRDQFGDLIGFPPAFTWFVSGGGTVNSQGSFIADGSASGTTTVRVECAGIGAAVAIEINSAPTFAVSAKAASSVVYNNMVQLSALGSDDRGEAALTYAWSTSGTVPAPVSFSANATHAAQKTAATFTVPGTYTMVCRITDGEGLGVTDSVTVTVMPVPSLITVTPVTQRMNPGEAKIFTAAVTDVQGKVITPTPTITWSVSGGGTISSTGLVVAATAAGGPYTVTAKAAGISGTTVFYINAAPTVATLINATPSTVTGKTATLSILGADDLGEPNLMYSWTVDGVPPGLVQWSNNGTNAAKTTVATFTNAGTYTLRCSVFDREGLSVARTVVVQVNPSLQTLRISPLLVRLNPAATTTFTASAVDIFGHDLPTAPVVTWAVNGGGTISPSGVLTAGATAGGPFTVTAVSGTKTATATIIVNAAPTIVQAAQGTLGIVSTKTATLSVLGADDDGEPSLIYTWSTTGALPAPVVFGLGNGTNAAKNAFPVTFALAGTYQFRCTITDQLGRSVVSPVALTVVPRPTSMSLSPTTATVTAGKTAAFSATVKDQFGTLMSAPVITWSMSGGATISSAGVVTAGAIAGGPFTVTATSGIAVGTAFIKVINTPPSIQLVATALPNPILDTTTMVAMQAADDSGNATTKYHWGTVGIQPAPVTFTPNDSNGAQRSKATFTKIGSYKLRCTVTDISNKTSVSDVTVVVQARPEIVISPVVSAIHVGQVQTFAALMRDQFAAPITPAPIFNWAVSGGGTITATGVFTANALPGGPFTATATAGSQTASVAFSVVDMAPTFAQSVLATPSPVVGKTCTLSMLGADDRGEGSLTYSWLTTGIPPAPVAFSANDANAAKSTVATFSKAGSYVIRGAIKDSRGQVVATSLALQVAATPTTMSLSPLTPRLNPGASMPFTALVSDQFRMPSALLPGVTWTVSGGGTITPAGVLTAAASPGGPFTVTATCGAKTALTTFMVNGVPTLATALAVTPNPVLGSSATLSVLGADDSGELGLTYSWSTTGTPPGSVAFSANATNAAKSTVVTFGKPGSYTIQCTITDGTALSITRSIVVVVNGALVPTTVEITPSSAVVAAAKKQAFTAVVRDQFGGVYSPAPSVTWTVSGGGSINSAGLFTAGSVVGGPYTVTAQAGSVAGTSGLWVTGATTPTPIVARAITVANNPVLGTAVDLSVLGNDSAGEANLTYTWSVSAPAPHSVIFTPNKTNAAKQTRVQFQQVGLYHLRCVITNADKRSVSAAIDVTVSPTVGAITVVKAGP